MDERRSLESNLIAHPANLSAILDKAAKECVPRYIVDDNGDVRGAVVNATWLREIMAKAGEYELLVAEPEYGRLRQSVAQALERAKVYAEALDGLADELLRQACPRCKERLGGTTARRARAMRVIGAVRAIGAGGEVAVVGVGSGQHSQGDE